MDKIKLAVSLPFPIFKVNNLVKYYEVKKPTGVEYMTLVLIKESSSTSLFSNTLTAFGVPENLQHIFADAVENLIDEEILTCSDGFYKYNFKDYRISSFKFTTKGKKIFQDEAIPTGKELEKKLDAYYEIPFKKFTLKLPQELESKPLMDTVFDDDFVSQFEIEKDVEEFYNSKKSAGIPIKKEEIITEVEQIARANWIGKYDVDMIIEGDNISIKFESEALNEFFKKYYTGDMVSHALLYKNKFQFSGKYGTDMLFSTYAENNSLAIKLPSELNDIQRQNAKLSISRGNYTISNSEIKVSDAEAIDTIDEHIELIKVDKADNIYAYIPGQFVFNNDVVGKVQINLLLQLKLFPEQLATIVDAIVKNTKVTSADVYDKLVRIIALTKQYDLAITKLENQMTDDRASNFAMLSEVKRTIDVYPKLLDGFKRLVTANFKAYCASMSKDSLETLLKVCAPLKKYIDIDEEEQMNSIIDMLDISKNKVKVFEILADYGFDRNMIAAYVNPIPEILEGRSVKDKVLIEVLNFDNNFSTLKRLTGIHDIKKCAFDIDSLNKIEFKKVFVTANGLLKKIEMFRQFNKDVYDDYDIYMDTFSRINDEVNMYEEAMKNPNKITKELIDKKITNGDYQYVLVNLATKLSIILRSDYGINEETLSEALSVFKKEKMVGRSVVDDFYALKECRNAQVHPEDRDKVVFTADDLRRWCNEVFELEGKK